MKKEFNDNVVMPPGAAVVQFAIPLGQSKASRLKAASVASR
ncbi:hypothetical protein [Pseudomonas sp. TH41]|nr:hypothetical protein [Pseudomonas sp. TH41]